MTLSPLQQRRSNFRTLYPPRRISPPPRRSSFLEGGRFPFTFGQGEIFKFFSERRSFFTDRGFFPFPAAPSLFPEKTTLSPPFAWSRVLLFRHDVHPSRRIRFSLRGFPFFKDEGFPPSCAQNTVSTSSFFLHGIPFLLVLKTPVPSFLPCSKCHFSALSGRLPPFNFSLSGCSSLTCFFSFLIAD